MMSDNSVQHRDIIVIGGSEGSIEPLKEILGGLPAHFPAAILIVLHTHSSSPKMMATILQQSSSMPVAYGEQGDAILPGRVYLAPPDKHLEVSASGLVCLSDGPKVNFSRPAVDRLFQTAADVFGPRVISVILSGNGADGAHGAIAIGAVGGLNLVQDPNDANVASMPAEAIDKDDPDLLVDVKALATILLHAVERSYGPIALN
ncbi:chemotaxis protein CheB [Pseudomonas sp. SWRI18]|uniref:chemotaxis protein CheB n=1 Tax=Pseudomonas sp. SWRI18 TaxID=2753888 RepID=UPI0016448ECF|nr:chemotaxis protein CheB [Pseudomonas sp. SWRI18]MBC3302031.1 chemotaxis protein CheB [Pseudomonas sp. SWRI18]